MCDTNASATQSQPTVELGAQVLQMETSADGERLILVLLAGSTDEYPLTLVFRADIYCTHAQLARLGDRVDISFVSDGHNAQLKSFTLAPEAINQRRRDVAEEECR